MAQVSDHRNDDEKCGEASRGSRYRHLEIALRKVNDS